MGMFDSVRIDIKCPFCGNTSEIECQTKELDCQMHGWRKGDFVSDKFNYLKTIADCLSEECIDYVYKEIGYHSGFGRVFYVKVILEKGVVTGEFEIIESDDD